ncbi:MAG: transposase [Akkermansiaceae bacterium]
MTKQKRPKPEEIILLLRECDASDLSQESFCQQKQISVATLHRWRKKYGMMDVADAKRLKSLEKENGELKKMYADAMLGIKILQEALGKSCKRGAPPELRIARR